jgi:putative ABC transport system ATP-binding protein
MRLEHVDMTFQMGAVAVEVLRDVSLEVPEGELMVIAGPSGSGKTTLVNIMGGLSQPTAGTVWFRDREVSAFSPAELSAYRRRAVGFVFQFYNLIPSLTARENVMVAAEIADDPLDVDELLELVGLEERRNHFPSQMSGGEQQRVAIARALVKRPNLLLCDEPTGALDFNTGKTVLGLLVELEKKLGTTVIIITHNLAISQLADRVVRLRSGEVVERRVNPHPASPDEISW